MAEALPGKGLMGWLGRQVGHVRKAIRTQPPAGQVVYHRKAVQEVLMPERPNVTLRRTTVDEVIVKGKDEG